MSENAQVWRKCSTCKKDIQFNTKYYECSVSTCTGQRTGYVFCSIPCWEVHLPGAKHRDAGAIEKRSEAATGQRRLIISQSKTASATVVSSEILVVVSKLKQYIREVSEMNTSDEISQKLSDLIREKCNEAIEKARQDGRKTVMARDF